MTYDFYVQARRSIWFYSSLTAVVLALGLWARWSDTDLSALVNMLGLVVLWVLLVVVATVDLFGYYWAARDPLMLLAPWPRGLVLAGKAAIHGVWFLIVFAVSFLANPPQSVAADGALTTLSALGSRALGIVAFFCLFALLLRVAKFIAHQAVAVGVLTLTYVLIAVAGVWLLVAATDADTAARFWVVGVDTSVTVPAQYVTLLPVTIGSRLSSTVPAGALVLSLAINGTLIVISLLGWWLLRPLRANFVQTT